MEPVISTYYHNNSITLYIQEVTLQHTLHIQYKLLIAAKICDKQTVVVTYSLY